MLWVGQAFSSLFHSEIIKAQKCKARQSSHSKSERVGTTVQVQESWPVPGRLQCNVFQRMFPDHKGWESTLREWVRETQQITVLGMTFFMVLEVQLGRVLTIAFGWDRLILWGAANLFMWWVATETLRFLWCFCDGQQLRNEADVCWLLLQHEPMRCSNWTKQPGFYDWLAGIQQHLEEPAASNEAGEVGPTDTPTPIPSLPKAL